jgi:RNA polymerase sigma-70 factor, ECF subfamily
MLDPDIVLRGIGGGPTDMPDRFELSGRDAVANLVLTRGGPQARFGRPAIVNGRPGAVVVRGGRLIALVAFTIVRDRVSEIDLVVNPDLLRDVRV